MGLLTWLPATAVYCSATPRELGVAAMVPTGGEPCCWLADYIRGMPCARFVTVFSDHGTFYLAELRDGNLDVNDLEQQMAFDNLVPNALNGTPLECDCSGLSCTVFDGDIKAQTQVPTGTPGACAVTLASQEFDCDFVSIQHIFILQKLYCTFTFLSCCAFEPTCLYMYPAQDLHLILSMQVRGF